MRHVVSPPLNAYINYLYYLDGPMPYPRERILPLPFLDLKINFGSALHVYEADHTKPSAAFSESWWVGLWSTSHTVEWPVDMRLFGVSFKPGGAYPFLQFPLSELHNRVVTLDALWGPFAAEIRERLQAAPTVQAQFALLERLLLERLRQMPYGLKAVRYAIGQIKAQHGALSIRSLSDDMGMSQKHLIAQFNQWVGGTPKLVARLYRFRHILSTIDPTRPVDWTLVAHQARYYDQSHFIRDFKIFTGHNPTDYLQLRRRVQTEKPQHATYLYWLPTG